MRFVSLLIDLDFLVAKLNIRVALQANYTTVNHFRFGSIKETKKKKSRMFSPALLSGDTIKRVVILKMESSFLLQAIQRLSQ